jgi:hypothetical protein
VTNETENLHTRKKETQKMKNRHPQSIIKIMGTDEPTRTEVKQIAYIDEARKINEENFMEMEERIREYFMRSVKGRKRFRKQNGYPPIRKCALSPPIWHWYNFGTRYRNQWQRFRFMWAVRRRMRHYGFVNDRRATRGKGVIGEIPGRE